MKLKDWLLANGLNQKQFAQKTDLSTAYVSMMLAGKYKPGRKAIKRISEETDGQVTAEDWKDGGA